MVYVYVIRNMMGRDYVGITKNVNRRIKEHNRGKTKSTRAHGPWRILFIEAKYDFEEARKREKYLKSGFGKMWIKEKWP